MSPTIFRPARLSPPRWAWAILPAALAALAADWGFTTSVSTALINQYAARFGDGARERLNDWKNFARTEREKKMSEGDLLVAVNRYVNRIAFKPDIEHWRVEDYWATPAESIASNAGDCEDFSIAKYFLLKELGLPVAKLRIIYVKAATLNQAHMVLAYYSAPIAEPLILDNLVPDVTPASRREDLVPVYSFNDEEVWVERQGRAGSPRQIRNWNSLLEKLEREART